MASGFRVSANILLPSEPKEAHNRGSMEPKHKCLMDMWSKETNERASPPSPTSSSAGSAPKSVQLGKSKPGGVAGGKCNLGDACWFHHP